MNAPFRTIGLCAIAVLLLVLAWLIYRQGMQGVQGVYDFAAPSKIGSLVVDERLPNEPVRTLGGASSSLYAYAGHPLWINFFATWCQPCKAELPEIERRYVSHQKEGLRVLGVDQQEPAFAVASFTRQFGVTYPVTIDRGASAFAFQIHVLPLSVFVDAGGVVRAIRIGQMQPDAMDDALRMILPAP